MQTTEIKEDQKIEWDRFIAENNSECFLQAWGWGEFQKKAGRKIWRIAVIEDGKILAQAQVIKHELKYFGNYLYCPRGPVVEKSKIQNPKSKIDIFDHLLKKIKEISKEEKSVFLKVEPAVESNGGLQIEDCKLPKGLRRSDTDIQPKNTLLIDLNKSEEELLSRMKQKTRYNLRLAEKKGVKICISRDHGNDFSKFWNLVEETSKRNGIVSHNREYYLKMLETLNAESGDIKNRLFSRLYLAEYGGRIIASNIVLFFSDLCIYLHGASSDADRNVMAPYLLQWKQILDAKELGCGKYDFWGISADGEKESWRGITRFKKGFGGFEKKYAGSFDLIFRKKSYFAYEAIKKMKKAMSY